MHPLSSGLLLACLLRTGYGMAGYPPVTDGKPYGTLSTVNQKGIDSERVDGESVSQGDRFSQVRL